MAKLYERVKKDDGKWTWKPHVPQPELRSIWWGLHPDNNQRWKVMCGKCHQEKNRSAMVMGHSGPDGKNAGYRSPLQSIKVMTYNGAVICTACWYDLMDELQEEEE